MSNALKIMDEIERNAHSPETWGKKWQALRTALEAQAEELARVRAEAKMLLDWALTADDHLRTGGVDPNDALDFSVRLGDLIAALGEVGVKPADDLRGYRRKVAQSAAHLKAEALQEARAIVTKALEHVGDAWSEISPREAIDSVHDYMIAQIDDAIEREANTAVYPYYEAKEES